MLRIRLTGRMEVTRIDLLTGLRRLFNVSIYTVSERIPVNAQRVLLSTKPRRSSIFSVSSAIADALLGSEVSLSNLEGIRYDQC